MAMGSYRNLAPASTNRQHKSTSSPDFSVSSKPPTWLSTERRQMIAALGT
jgi:hypothetical protein